MLNNKIYNEDLELNLPEEIARAMEIMGFKQESIMSFINSPEVQRCKILPATLQKAEITYYLNNLMLLSGIEIPDEVRTALTIAFKPVDWLGDLTVVVLPFIRQFEDDFYK